MRESSRRVAVLLLALLAAGCETQKPAPSKPGRIVFPPPPADAVIEFVGTFSRAADFGLGQSGLQKILLGTEERDAAFIGPSSVAFAGDDGSFYVVDQRLDAVFIASRTRKEFRVFPGEGSGKIQKALAVATGPDGSLFVSDVGAASVFEYGPDLRFRASYGGPKVFTRPTGVAVSADGKRLAVCDTPAHRVQVFSVGNARLLKTIGGTTSGEKEGEFSSPYAVTFDAKGFLYVADYLNYRIQVFGPEGDFVSAFGKSGDKPGDIGRPRGLAVDSARGVIYEVDGAFSLVQMFNPDGEPLMWFGTGGSGPAEFSLPTGIALRGDLIVVADTVNHRLQLFRFLGIPRAKP